MRIIPFPTPGGENDEWAAELDAALTGVAAGPRAREWRELREDVRSLGPALDEEGMLRLEEELVRRGVPTRGEASPGPEAAPAGDDVGIGPAAVPARPGPGRPLARVAPSRTFQRWRAAAGRRRALLASVPALAALGLAALILAGSQTHGSNRATRVSGTAGSSRRADQLGVSQPEPHAAASPNVSGAAATASAPAGTGAPGRVQQLGASLTLATTPASLQATADRVGTLTVGDGGYVQSSNVQVGGHGEGEGTMTLSVPSAHLGAVLGAIARLGDVRSESQSLQDITGSYESAQRELGDAQAERQALLRALARASSEGEIDSLRERLASNRGAIARDHAAVDAISRRASSSEVEVTIIATRPAASSGLTIGGGLHDAGHVLVVVATVLLIALAILLPLALVLAGGMASRSAWTRQRRERALDGR